MYLSPFLAVARGVLAHPRVCLGAALLVTVGLGLGLARLELETGGSALRPDAAPYVAATELDRLRFRDPRQVIVLVSATAHGPSVASPAGFRFLAALHDDLRRLPAVRGSSILSLAGLPRPERDAAGFSVGSHLGDVPDDPAEFAALVAQVRSEHLTDGLLLSADGRHAALYVPLAENRPVDDLVAELEAWAAVRADASFLLQLSGPEIAEATLGRMVLRDLTVLVPVMLVVIVCLLLAVFRHVGGVIVPMAESLLVLVWTFGAMGWLGVPVTLVTTILPVVLMAMSITDEIHLLERVQGHLEATPTASLHGPVEAALEEVGRPIIATSVTTALGFLSFLSASIAPMREFGVFTAFGILAAMVFTFAWIPALIVVLPASWFRRRFSSPRAQVPVGLRAWCVHHPSAALVAGVAVVLACVPGAMRLRVQDSWVGNFAAGDPLVRAERVFNDSFWGSYRFDVVVEGDAELFYTPLGAELVEELERVGAAAPHVGGVLSYLAFFEDIARAVGEPGPVSSLSLQQVFDVAAIAEMSESRLRLRQLLTDGGEAARVRLFVADADYARSVELARYLDRNLPGLADRYGVEYHYSGDLPAALAVVSAIVSNQLRSIGWTLLTVTAALLVLFARGRAALVAMVPVVAAVVVLFGGMGYLAMPLGIATSMFAALTVGVGVDFGIHVIERYRQELVAGADHGSALRATFAIAGRAVAWNALVLGAGFMVLTISSLKPNHSLGVLLASAMLACYAGTMVFLPRLLRFVGPAVLAFVISSSTAAIATAAGKPCDRAADDAARAVVAELEKDFRAAPHITRMHIVTKYGENHPLHEYSQKTPVEKTLWGVFNGDAEETWLLYTFSGPGRLAGTTLLMQDFADPSSTDAMWLYLRSFDSFSKLDAHSLRVMVPGTALTYEDSRGFIPLDKYDFSFAGGDGAEVEEGQVRILACPRDAETRDNLGYDSVVVLVDETKGVVRHIEYRDLGGKPMKTYTLVREVADGDGWRPGEVRMEHLAGGFTTMITYEHWRPQSAPPASLYAPETDEEKFMPRLKRVLDDAGLGDRIDQELAVADEHMREYERRLQEYEAKQRAKSEASAKTVAAPESTDPAEP